jgi:hypothetical protein
VPTNCGTRDQIHGSIVVRCGVVVNLLAQLGLSRRLQVDVAAACADGGRVGQRMQAPNRHPRGMPAA